MVSNYRGSLTLGFNSWMIILPAMIILCFFIGWKRYDLKSHSLEIKSNFTDGIRDVIALSMSIIAGLMVMLESFWGIVQFSDNHLAGNDSAVWSLLAPFGFGFAVALVMGLILIFVMDLAGSLRCKWLTAEIEEIKAARRRNRRKNQIRRK